MAIYQVQYEVPWQLIEADYESKDRAAGPGTAAAVSEGTSQSLARFAGLLASADATAVVACRKDDMTVETAGPETSWLLPGAVLAYQDHLGPGARRAVTSLLTGRSAWLDCLPPDGFRSAALIAAPSLAPSKRLVLVACTHARLDKRNLGLAAGYLAHHQAAKQPLDLSQAAA